MSMSTRSIAKVITEQLDRHQAEVERRIPYARIRAGLDVISEFARGIRYTLDEVCFRIRMAIRKAEDSRFKSCADWWTS
jgi:hypothetical protein